MPSSPNSVSIYFVIIVLILSYPNSLFWLRLRRVPYNFNRTAGSSNFHVRSTDLVLPRSYQKTMLEKNLRPDERLIEIGDDISNGSGGGQKLNDCQKKIKASEEPEEAKPHPSPEWNTDEVPSTRPEESPLTPVPQETPNQSPPPKKPLVPPSRNDSSRTGIPLHYEFGTFQDVNPCTISTEELLAPLMASPPPPPKDPPEPPPPPQASPKSRIPDYDEFERFKNSSRPPDSHYPPEEPSPPPKAAEPSPPPPPPPPPPRPSPSSRIPDYDEFARFRDSSRPPDSHYPMGPGPSARRSGGTWDYPNLALLIWSSCCYFAFFLYSYFK